MPNLEKALADAQQEQSARIGVITGIFNRERHRQILTADNHKILSVGKFNDSARGTNTVIRVEIDTLHGSEEPVLARHRYLRIPMYMYRPTLKEAFKVAGFAKNSDGSFVIPAITDIDAALAAIKDKLVISKDEIKAITLSEGKLAFQAKDDSLGYTGAVSLTDKADSEDGDGGEEPLDPKWNEVVRGTVPTATALDDQGNLLCAPNFAPKNTIVLSDGNIQLMGGFIADTSATPNTEAQFNPEGKYELTDGLPTSPVFAITGLGDIKRSDFEQYRITIEVTNLGLELVLLPNGNWSYQDQEMPSTLVNDTGVQFMISGFGEGTFVMRAEHITTGLVGEFTFDAEIKVDPNKVETIEVNGPEAIDGLSAVYTYTAKNKLGEVINDPDMVVEATISTNPTVDVGLAVIDKVAKTITFNFKDDRFAPATSTVNIRIADKPFNASPKVNPYHSVPIDEVTRIEEWTISVRGDRNSFTTSYKFFNRLNNEIEPKELSGVFTADGTTGVVTRVDGGFELLTTLSTEPRLVAKQGTLIVTADKGVLETTVEVPANVDENDVAKINLTNATNNEDLEKHVIVNVEYLNHASQPITPETVNVKVTRDGVDAPFTLSENKLSIRIDHPEGVEEIITFTTTVNVDADGPTASIETPSNPFLTPGPTS